LLSLRFWDRTKDVSFAISKLLKEPFFKKKIDRRRVGFIGYSLGGMTGLALAGARAQNLQAIAKKIQGSIPEIDDAMVESLDFKEGYASFYDRRIKAMVLLSPAAYIFPPQSLKSITMPIALVTSEGDEVLPFKEHAYPVIQYLNHARLKILKDTVSHYVFLNRVSEQGKGVIRDEIQSEIIQRDRLSVHQEVGQFVVDFFKEHLGL
ncbi:MAG: Dienelactone hydrolase protein, partial [uncultured bacterium]